MMDRDDSASLPPDLRLGRRDLIRKAAGVGVVAWTAPVILGSLASPAAASTCPPANLRFAQFGVNGTCTPQQAPATTSVDNGGCQPPGWLGNQTNAATIGPGNTLSIFNCVVIISGTCGNNSLDLTMTFPVGCLCTFVSATVVKGSGCVIATFPAANSINFSGGPNANLGTIRIIACCPP